MATWNPHDSGYRESLKHPLDRVLMYQKQNVVFRNPQNGEEPWYKLKDEYVCLSGVMWRTELT